MNGELETDEEILKIRLEGHFDIGVAAGLLEQVRAWDAAVEFDLSAVESIDLPALQFLLVVFQSKRRLNQPVANYDGSVFDDRTRYANDAGIAQRVDARTFSAQLAGGGDRQWHQQNSR